MASSKNRQWTSMFKSKPSDTQHQCQHDGNTPPGVDGVDGEAARTPHPKQRWNPKAEQIRILEGIFNSGMVNPPRDEIRRIRVKLQEYGQVGDANVFYWFQNRKSRSKHKQKQLQPRQFSNPPTKKNYTTTAAASASVSVPLTASASYSSSKSYDPSNSSGCSDKTLHSSTSLAGVSNSPTKSVSNKTYYPEANHIDFAGLPVDLLFRNKAPVEAKSSDLNYSRLRNQHTMMSRQHEQEQFKITGLYDRDTNIKSAAEASHGKNHFYQLGRTTPVNTIVAPCITARTTTTSPTTQDPFNGLLQGISGNRDRRVVVLINEVAFEVGVGHLNVREAFGTEAILFHSSGLPVLLNDWGFTLHPLQHGASYFLV